jgi:hypothetical protein
LTNIYDVATAVASVGVRVSKAFVEEHALDDERYFTTPSKAINYVADDGSRERKPLPPRPPRLDAHGYTSLNGLQDTAIGRLKKLPEHSDGYGLFVVYEGASKDVAGNVTINQNEDNGSEFLKEKFGDNLKARLANACAIYCVANPPAPDANKRQKTA